MTARPSGGGMAEWLKAAVLKTVRGRKVSRGFESLSLRHGSWSVPGKHSRVITLGDGSRKGDVRLGDDTRDWPGGAGLSLSPEGFRRGVDSCLRRNDEQDPKGYEAARFECRGGGAGLRTRPSMAVLPGRDLACSRRWAGPLRHGSAGAEHEHGQSIRFFERRGGRAAEGARLLSE